jgi:hypothetical protein
MEERTCLQSEKRETLNVALAKMTFFKKSQLFGLSGSQRRHYHVYPRSLQKTNVILQPVSSSQTRRYRQTNSLYFYPKRIHKRTQRESGLPDYDISCEQIDLDATVLPSPEKQRTRRLGILRQCWPVKRERDYIYIGKWTERSRLLTTSLLTRNFTSGLPSRSQRATGANHISETLLTQPVKPLQ